MTPLPNYIWLIDTIRRAGKITHKELSDLWRRKENLSYGKPLHRATFNHWRDAIADQFGIDIECQKTGGYLYYIANPENIDDNKLKKWMIDSLAIGNMLKDNLALKDRIIIDEIPSGHDHLTTIFEAMKENRVVDITYRPFRKSHGYTFPVEPYAVKLFENRWYVLARNIDYGDLRIYGLDRIENVAVTGNTFKLLNDFDAEKYFSTYFGIVVDGDVKPERIVIRANEDHKHYLKSLPLHHSQRLIEDCGEYADFDLYLAPTYDFVMRLLHVGAMVEVISPASLRKTMKGWISEMYELYKND